MNTEKAEEPLVVSEMTLTQYDVEMLHARERAAVRKHERSIQRWKSMAAAVGYVTFASMVIGVAFIIWKGVEGPSAIEQLRDDQQTACVEARGNWLPIGGGRNTKSTYTCLFGEVREP